VDLTSQALVEIEDNHFIPQSQVKSQFKELKSQLQIERVEKENFKKQLTALQGEKDIALKELESLNAGIIIQDTHKFDLGDGEIYLKEVKNKFELLRFEIEVLREKSVHWYREYLDLKSKSSALVSRNRDLNSENESLKSDIKILGATHPPNFLTQERATKFYLQNRISALEAQLKEKLEEIKGLGTELKVLGREHGKVLKANQLLEKGRKYPLTGRWTTKK
jgi:FtsZ-binding cell division protein ZapB